MIKHLYRSKSDIENLSKLRTAITEDVDSFNYKKVIVKKPWGYEYLAFENSHVAVWVLYFKKNHGTSMHCHPNKKTSLIVLHGKVVSSTLEGWTDLCYGQGLCIDEAVFHSTKAVSEDGAFVMELESPPNKKDLVRLKDQYGRKQGYEGEESMSKKIKDYEYIDFHKINLGKNYKRRIKTCSISLSSFERMDDIHQGIQKEKGEIICLLRGKLHDHSGSIVLSAGDAALLTEIKSIPKILAFGSILYLSISWIKK